MDVCGGGAVHGSQIPGESSLRPRSLCHKAPHPFPMMEHSQAWLSHAKALGHRPKGARERGAHGFPRGVRLELYYLGDRCWGLQAHDSIRTQFQRWKGRLSCSFHLLPSSPRLWQSLQEGFLQTFTFASPAPSSSLLPAPSPTNIHISRSSGIHSSFSQNLNRALSFSFPIYK